MAGAAQPKFTGKHMAAILVTGFGIVIAVNLLMASLATSGFQGTVVDNSYAASQRFNRWLDAAKADKALGWTAAVSRDATGHVLLDLDKVPPGAVITAQLRRPIGTREFAQLSFAALPNGRYRSTVPAGPGRWTIRLRITAQGAIWAQESEMPRDMPQ